MMKKDEIHNRKAAFLHSHTLLVQKSEEEANGGEGRRQVCRVIFSGKSGKQE